MTARLPWGRLSTLLREEGALLRFAVFYASLMLAAGFGQWLAVLPGSTITFYPVNGVIVAGLMHSRRGEIGKLLVVALLADLTSNAIWYREALPTALGYFTANALEALLAAWLLRPFFAEAPRLRTLGEVGAIGVVAAMAPIVAATLGCGIDDWIGKHRFADAWPLWWLGDAAGMMLSLPLSLVAAELVRERNSSQPSGEAWALGAAVVLVTALCVGGRFVSPYLVVPPLVWAAARFGFPGAVLGLVASATISAAFTSLQMGAFAGAGEELSRQDYLELLVFLSVCGFSSLVAAALSQQRETALVALRASNTDLERRVAERTQMLDNTARWLARERERLGIALRAGALGVYEWRPDTNELWWSPEVYAVFGVAPHEFIPSVVSFNAAVHPEDREELWRKIAECLHEERVFYYEFRIRLPDGAGVRWVANFAQGQRTADGALVSLTGVAQDVTQRREVEERTRLLMQEVNHRSKNMLALVQAIARQTAAADTTQFLERFSARLRALAASQDLLVESAWVGVDLDELITSQLRHFGDLLGVRVFLDGPKVRVNAAAAQTLGMAFHELATNASKYGALSDECGRVFISWRAGPPDPEFFDLSWKESGGPPVSTPARTGFGSSVLLGVTRAGLGAEVSLLYDVGGVTWRLRCAMDKIT